MFNFLNFNKKRSYSSTAKLISPFLTLPLLADPGEARGCSINSHVINWLNDSVSLFLPQLYGPATPKRLEITLPVINYFLNPEGHQNPIDGSKVTAILLKGCILPIGGASAVEGLRSTGLPLLVLWHIDWQHWT